ncbi:MAG: IS1 family transposase [Pirellulales bacterium]|nr:IS1 family transposase [Pirellulales bacterium]
MIAPACKHDQVKKHGHDRDGNQRFRCTLCGKTWIQCKPQGQLGPMRLPIKTAKLVLQLLLEGSSIRSTERITRVHRDTICKLIVRFGDACQNFLDMRMKNLTLTHLQFDEQWTYVAKKQARLTTTERENCYDIGDIYLWTCVDRKTKLMPSFLIGKRSADNARRFVKDVASRLVLPNAHSSDNHAYQAKDYEITVQVSTDGFAAYPEAVDLAFGPYVKYGTIIKDYKNASMIYTPSEMVGTQRTGRRGIDKGQEWTICTSHIERLNGTQRLFLKRLNRLTLCFSKKLRNLEAAFAMFAAYYNYCWRTRKPGKSGKKRPTAAMMAKLTDHLWGFDEFFDAVLRPATQS